MSELKYSNSESGNVPVMRSRFIPAVNQGPIIQKADTMNHSQMYEEIKEESGFSTQIQRLNTVQNESDIDLASGNVTLLSETVSSHGFQSQILESPQMRNNISSPDKLSENQYDHDLMEKDQIQVS